MSDPVRVDVGGCRCPGTPHPSDWVELAPAPSVALGIAALYVIRASENEADLRGALAGVYLRNGIVAWSFVDEDRRPVKVAPDAIERLLPFADGGLLVADAADALYSNEVLRPLVARSSISSPDGPTAASTSPSPSTGTSLPTDSSPSSPSVTDGTPSEVLAR